MPDNLDIQPRRIGLLVITGCSLVVGILIALWLEFERGVILPNPAGEKEFFGDPMSVKGFYWNPKVLPFVFALGSIPLILWCGRWRREPIWFEGRSLPPFLIALVLGGVAFAGFWGVEDLHFKSLPPAFHDEYSYIFQAKTMLLGRVSNPVPDAHQALSQMHVLSTNGVFASRYFPGVGIWLAPWIAIDQPFLGYQLTGAVCVMLVFAVGRQIAMAQTERWHTDPEAAEDVMGNRHVCHVISITSALFLANSAPKELLVEYLLQFYPIDKTILSLASVVIVAIVTYFIGTLVTRSHSEVDSTVGVANGVGFLAGILFMSTPAMLLFSNLLLSHHPTLLGLLVFTWGYLHAIRNHATVWALIGGIGLTGAMLSRPLTAFGYCAPFVLLLLTSLITRRLQSPMRKGMVALIPIAIGLGVLGFWNKSITGDYLQTPYGLYTAVYTPSHVYGFDNVERGLKARGPETLEHYDNWAVEQGNLDYGGATRLFWKRLRASSEWTVGLVLFGVIALLAFMSIREQGWPIALVIGAAIGVHLAYFAFAFSGIFDLSYVFETTPLLCLVAACTTGWFLRRWSRTPAVTYCVVVFFMACSFGPANRLLDGSISQNGPRPSAISEVRFSRSYYAVMESEFLTNVIAPAVVVIKPDPFDRHRDLVTNDPDFTSPIVRARWVESELDQLRIMFPERTFYLYDVPENALSPL